MLGSPIRLCLLLRQHGPCGLAISSFFCKNTWNLPPPIKFAESPLKQRFEAF